MFHRGDARVVNARWGMDRWLVMYQHAREQLYPLLVNDDTV